MTSLSLTTAFVVDQTPKQAFAVITPVRGWWSGEIEGSTDERAEEFTSRYQDVHCFTQTITELIPGKKVTWHVAHANLNLTSDPHEWAGTDLLFDVAAKGDRTELRFTPVGLVPGLECVETCSNAWGFYITNSLRNLIATGEGAPNPKEGSGPTAA
jgi:hypothetical protein